MIKIAKSKEKCHPLALKKLTSKVLMLKSLILRKLMLYDPDQIQSSSESSDGKRNKQTKLFKKGAELIFQTLTNLQMQNLVHSFAVIYKASKNLYINFTIEEQVQEENMSISEAKTFSNFMGNLEEELFLNHIDELDSDRKQNIMKVANLQGQRDFQTERNIIPVCLMKNTQKTITKPSHLTKIVDHESLKKENHEEKSKDFIKDLLNKLKKVNMKPLESNFETKYYQENGQMTQKYEEEELISNKDTEKTKRHPTSIHKKLKRKIILKKLEQIQLSVEYLSYERLKHQNQSFDEKNAESYAFSQRSRGQASRKLQYERFPFKELLLHKQHSDQAFCYKNLPIL